MTAAALTFGNRCGHDPREPRLHVAWHEPRGKSRPKIIRELQKRLSNYYKKTDLIPSLASCHRADGAKRDQRSERREACVLLLLKMVEHLDVLTLRVGRPGDDGWSGITMEEMAAAARLNPRRAERAIRDLKLSGLVAVYPIAKEREDQPGEYYGIAAIRKISDALFGLLGLKPWLMKERERAYKKRQEHQTDRQTAVNMLQIQNLRRRMKNWKPGGDESLAQLQADMNAMLKSPKARSREPPDNP